MTAAAPHPPDAPVARVLVFLHAAGGALLAAGPHTGTVLEHPDGRLTWQPASSRPPRSAAARVCARYRVHATGDVVCPPPADPGEGAPGAPPHFHVQCHGVTHLGPPGLLRYPGLLCARLRAAVERCVLREAPALRAATARHGVEQAALVLWDPAAHPDGVRLERYTGPDAEPHAVAPHCGGRRDGGTGRDPRAAALLGEVHTHPRLPRLPPGAILPPSASDLYQLMLAVAKGEHNSTHVVGPEGVYHAEMAPDHAHTLLREVWTFMQHHRMGPATAAEAVATCQQPLAEPLRAVADRVPGLARLLTRPGQVQTRLRRSLGMAPVAAVADHLSAAAHYCDAMRAEGLRVCFIPLQPT